MLLTIPMLVGASLLVDAEPKQERRRPPRPDTIIHDCMPGPWIVFFGEDDARLDAWARRILDRMLESRRFCGSFDLDVVGHRDDGGRLRVAPTCRGGQVAPARARTGTGRDARD